MRKNRLFIFLLCGTIFLGMPDHCRAQPKTPKDKIPPDITNELKTKVEGLYDKDPAKRAEAAMRIGDMGPQAKPAVPLLIEMLDDNDHKFYRLQQWKGGQLVMNKPIEESPAKSAAIALGKIGDEKAIGPLISCLNSGDWILRDGTVIGLKKFGAPAVVPLIEYLKNSPPDLDSLGRWNAIDILGFIGDSRAAAPILNILDNEKSIYAGEDVRTHAAIALGKLQDIGAVDVLIAAQDDSNPTVKSGALHSLIKIGTPAVEPAIQCLTNKNPEVRESAVMILGNSLHPRTVALLIEMLNDENANVRSRSAQMLGEIRGTSATEALVALLNDKEEIVRRAASEALTNINGRNFVAELALKKEDVPVRATRPIDNNEATALGKVLDSGTSIEQLKTFERLGGAGQSALFALSSLTRLMADDTMVSETVVGVDNLNKTAKDKNMPVEFFGTGTGQPVMMGELKTIGEEAAYTLATIGGPAEDTLIAALKDTNAAVRKRAAMALGNTNTEKAIKALIDTVKSGDDDMRSAAGEALIKIGRPAVNSLLAAVKYNDRNTRLVSMIVIAHIGDTTATPELVNALGDEDWIVRMTAAQALGSIRDKRAIPYLITAILRERESPNVAHEAGKALETLTGESFGASGFQWRQWWLENDR